MSTCLFLLELWLLLSLTIKEFSCFHLNYPSHCDVMHCVDTLVHCVCSSDDEDSQGGSFGPGNETADKERFAR